MKLQLRNLFILIFIIISSPFICLIILYNKTFNKTRQKRILIINNAKIGDLICTTPVFRAIKEKYPSSYLGVLVIPRCKGILQNNKRIDKLLVYPINKGLNIIDFFKLLKIIRKEKFNIAVNIVPGTTTLVLPFFAGIPVRITAVIKEYGWFYWIIAKLLYQNRFVYKKNTLSIRNHLAMLQFIDIENGDFKKEIFITEDAFKKAEQFLEKNNINNNDIVVGSCLSAGNKIKEWGINNFAKLVDLIINKFNYKIIFIGGPSDKEELEQLEKIVRSDIVISYSDFNLSEVGALIKRFNYFISVDTGPLYIANTLDVPVLDILGPCSAYDQPPIYEKCVIVYNKNLECRPCSFYAVAATECKLNHLECLRGITPEIVLNNFGELIKICK